MHRIRLGWDAHVPMSMFLGLLEIVWKLFLGFLELPKHAGKDLEAQVFLIAQTIGTALKDADFAVETLDEAEESLLSGWQ